MRIYSPSEIFPQNTSTTSSRLTLISKKREKQVRDVSAVIGADMETILELGWVGKMSFGGK